MNSFTSLEEQVAFQSKNIDYLQQQNYELQHQIATYEELVSMGVTLESYQQMQQQIKELQSTIKLCTQDKKNLQKQLDSNQVKFQDRAMQQLQSENIKLKSELKQLRQKPTQPTSAQKLCQSPIKQVNPNVILKSTQDLSTDTHYVLYIKGQPNFKSPYVEIMKGKYDNVKFIKKLKSGFEQSYYDLYHFDQVGNELSKSTQYLDRYHSIAQGRGLLLANQLCILFGAPKSNKKQHLLQYIDTLLQQLKQQYDIFNNNVDYQSINVHISYEETLNGVQKHLIEQQCYITKETQKNDNDQILRDTEMTIQMIKLTIINKMKLTAKDPNKQHYKIRMLSIDAEKVYSKDSTTSKVLIFTSNNVIPLKSHHYIEESLKIFLQQKDKGKLLTDVLKLPSLSMYVQLCVQPTVPQYQVAFNTFQLAKVIRNAKFNQEVPQNSDKYSAILENQILQLEQLIKNSKQKQKSAQWDSYRAKKQYQTLLIQNEEAINKNTILKQQMQQLIQQLITLQTSLAQQISAKQQKSLALNKSVLPQKSQTIKSLENAQRSLSNLLAKQSSIDLSVSPTKSPKKLNFQSELLMPSSSEGEDVVDDIADASEASESESLDEEQSRKQSLQSMI